MEIGDKVFLSGKRGFELVARTVDGRPIVDGLGATQSGPYGATNSLDRHPFIANECDLTVDNH